MNADIYTQFFFFLHLFCYVDMISFAVLVSNYYMAFLKIILYLQSIHSLTLITLLTLKKKERINEIK